MIDNLWCKLCRTNVNFCLFVVACKFFLFILLQFLCNHLLHLSQWKLSRFFATGLQQILQGKLTTILLRGGNVGYSSRQTNCMKSKKCVLKCLFFFSISSVVVHLWHPDRKRNVNIGKTESERDTNYFSGQKQG